MPRIAAFLRAVNVGGRRITNDQLAAACTAAGLDDVATYQAAGNVVGTTDRSPADAEVHLAAELEAAFGWAVPTMVRTLDELAVIAAAEPFGAPVDGATVHVLLCAAPLTRSAARAVAALATAADELHVAGREVYWRRHGKLMEATIDDAELGRAIDTVTTMRTIGTLQRMAARFT